MTFYFAARDGSRALQSLTAEQRAEIINNIANSLMEHQTEILAANKKDLENARNDGEENISYQLSLFKFTLFISH